MSVLDCNGPGRVSRCTPRIHTQSKYFCSEVRLRIKNLSRKFVVEKNLESMHLQEQAHGNQRKKSSKARLNALISNLRSYCWCPTFSLWRPLFACQSIVIPVDLNTAFSLSWVVCPPYRVVVTQQFAQINFPSEKARGNGCALAYCGRRDFRACEFTQDTSKRIREYLPLGVLKPIPMDPASIEFCRCIQELFPYMMTEDVCTFLVVLATSAMPITVAAHGACSSAPLVSSPELFQIEFVKSTFIMFEGSEGVVD